MQWEKDYIALAASNTNYAQKDGGLAGEIEVMPKFDE